MLIILEISAPGFPSLEMTGERVKGKLAVD